jgi:hypothetical protein
MIQMIISFLAVEGDYMAPTYMETNEEKREGERTHDTLSLEGKSRSTTSVFLLIRSPGFFLSTLQPEKLSKARYKMS